MSLPIFQGTGAFVHPSVQIGTNVAIGHGSIVGYGDPSDIPTVLGNNVTIGAFCVVYFGAVVGSHVSIDDYCKISSRAAIGHHSKLLYGKHVYDEATVGAHCIIGGHVADRTIIEDNVTYLGEIAHSHRDASLDWDDTEEDSPIIYKGSVVGVNALIVGPRKIGPCAYVAAGEIVRSDIGPGMMACKGIVAPLTDYRGVFKTRC